MALLERVSTLVRANINDLIDKAEEPEKMIKQVILDMQNQLLQVKTQVAIAIADEHLLAKKQKENTAKIAEWMRKAEMAVEKDKDARAIMRNAQKEEFKHFGMDLEFLLRRTPKWREILQGILFQPGDIVAHGEEAEDSVD